MYIKKRKVVGAPLCQSTLEYHTMLDDVDEALKRTDIGVNHPPHPHLFRPNLIHRHTLVSMAVLPPYIIVYHQTRAARTVST